MAKTKDKKARKQTTPTPKLKCDVVVGFQTPYPSDACGRVATQLVKFEEEFAAWRSGFRAHITEGKSAASAAKFDPRHFMSGIDRMRMSQSAFERLEDKWAEQLEADVDSDVVFGSRYSPVVVEVVHAMNCRHIRRGQPSKHPRVPSGWDVKFHGEWMYRDEDGKRTIPSGYFFDSTMPRKCHATSVEQMVTDPDDNIFTIGNNRYVVGDGTNVRSAAQLVSSQDRGNFLHGDMARKRLSLAGIPGVADVVFRIEDRPNNGDNAFTARGFSSDVGEIVFRLGQVTTPGFLYRGTKRIGAKELRTMDADTKGLTFKSCMSEPIIGKQVPWDAIWAEIQVIAGRGGIAKLRERGGRSEDDVDSSPQDKSLVNANTTCRVEPSQYAYGFRASQLGMVPVKYCDADGNISMGVVIGARSNVDYNVGVNDAKAELADEADEAPAPAAKKAAAPKAKVAKKKATAKKTAKKKAAKKKDTTIAAPPVDADSDADAEVDSDADDLADGSEADLVAAEA